MDTSFLLRTASSKFPDHIALAAGERKMTFGEFDHRVDALAAGLRAKLPGGAAVASLLLNDIDTVALYLATARAGMLNVPINYRLNNDEVRYIIKDCAPRALAVDSEHVGRAGEILQGLSGVEHVVVFGDDRGAAGQLHVEDLAALWDGRPVELDIDDRSDGTVIYSSGTSGFPKGVVRSHRANLWGAVNAFIGSPRTNTDVELFVLPLFGIGFVVQVMPTLLAGGTVVLDRVFDPVRTWELIERNHVTRAFLAPTMLALMLDVPDNKSYNASSLETLSVAYEFAPDLRARTVARFGDILRNMYGLTEAQLCITAPREFPADPTNAGQPMGLARLMILDPDGNEVPPGTTGEITFHAPSVMSRYLGKPEATASTVSADRVRTGDLGYLDEARNLHFTGRLKEIVKSGGFNIDPVEVENVLLQYPGVREAALIGVPDERWGERAVAYVAGLEGLDPTALIQHCRDRIAGFKVPKEVRVLGSLPKNATGKIHRAVLRAEWTAEPSPNLRS